MTDLQLSRRPATEPAEHSGTAPLPCSLLAALVATLASCGEGTPSSSVDPRQPASVPASVDKAEEVVHLIDRAIDVRRARRSVDVSVPPRVDIAVEPVGFVSGVYAFPLPWPGQEHTLQVLDDESVHPRVAISPQRVVFQAEDADDFDLGTVEPLRLGQPGTLALRHGGTANFGSIQFTEREQRLALRARTLVPGPVELILSIGDQPHAVSIEGDEFTETEWTVQPRVLRALDVSVRVEETSGGATESTRDPVVAIDWIRLENDGPSKVLVAVADPTRVRLRYAPRPPAPRENLLGHATGGSAHFLSVSDAAVLEWDGDLTGLRVDGTAVPQTDWARGSLELLDLSPGLVKLEWDGSPGRVEVVQARASVLPLLLDANLWLRDTVPSGALEPGRSELADGMLCRFECRGDRRAGYWLPAGSEFEIQTDLRAGDRLRFSVGAHTPWVDATDADVDFEVWWRRHADAEPTRLSQSRWRADQRWLDHDVEIEPALEGSGLLRFVTLGAESGAGLTAAFAEPRIVRAKRSGPRRPNVLLYLVDTLRADHLHCYGGERENSPNIDALARDSYRIENFYSISSWTRPSTASILTGLSPTKHSVIRDSDSLPFSVTTLAELFRAEGYSTWAAVANPHVFTRGLQFEQGFHRFVSPQGFSRPADDSKTINDTVLPWIERHRDEPFFLYCHVMDPHSPYSIPPRFAGRFSAGYDGILKRRPLKPRLEFGPIDARIGDADIEYLRQEYDSDILHVDGEFERLRRHLEDCGVLDNTVVVFLSDHGEEFREHGRWEHGGRMWEEVLRVPMILWLPPDLRKGRGVPRSIGGRWTHLDVVPTLADLVNAAGRSLNQGDSLLPALAGESLARAPILLEESDRLGALIDGDSKLIFRQSQKTGRWHFSLYDLAADPLEQVDLSLSQPGELQRMRALRERAIAHRARLDPQIHVGSSGFAASDSTLQMLRDLGYVDSR